MRVCVIGTGYVGLVTGVCLARTGHHVTCVDNNEEKVKLMKSGQSPIYEPGLSELMQAAMTEGTIEFTSDLASGVDQSDILFIAVGTPPLPTGESDTRYVEAVARGIGTSLKSGSNYKVIVNKSTVPIGSGDWVRTIVLDSFKENSPGQPEPAFAVVSNPEFLREGSAIYDTFNPDRIVLGSNDPKALGMMSELYDPIVRRDFAENQALPPVPIVTTDLASAEMVKYAANAFLATKISFINEVANICDRVGADVTQVAKGIGLDSRIGPKFLNAGIGWGGSCFPKDVSALVHTASDYGYDAELLKAAVNVNQRQRAIAIEKLQQTLKILKGKTIGLLGLTFKPDTDDMRDAPSLILIEQLSRLGAKVKAYDPIVSQTGMRHGLSNVYVETDPELLADGCDALVIVTEWEQFRTLDYAKMAKAMHNPTVVDGRNFLDRAALEAAGFHYVGIGR
ncbi:MAG: UDP-glucose/GDP-mannose dehydrogenase family protein [Limnothrix sp.]|uniref:UDP-glucose dehydrogenase family protein n=1 Tax=unclassified Limnothrix TaxID=2632864 RepID=UPI00081DB33C|nr:MULTISPECIES: UDP-glucose/GDP-mannose dehydrogenase family protein [unclassified Limnothrix]MEB3117576.1 UDP-glucose/GDP-mannose dehydrogenase family protein [Limnothrix sp.]OCQ93642.1 UDP-glucose 6-dehydrogenase [Limnothrix sp. P13C2]MBD2160181.1 UDP-glucose/GDP-mannose dehydrogenase family protein [Limnothrix sp. FACHB-1083]MBD2190884.1 UDP-glucose/GDP-mannose dehydrogenase family protein [Limnothrix sp. FACHB-1088]MBD2552452.1 UDP-glucose/GDP-mannose dehydrogenase family protein [Limnoth